MKAITNKKFTVVQSADGVEMTLETHLLKKNFKLPYCSTVHSVQGLIIGQQIYHFDCNTPYGDLNFIFTAGTRARKFKKKCNLYSNFN